MITLLAIVALLGLEREDDRFPPTAPASGPPLTNTGEASLADAHGFLYGLVTTIDGGIHEGRLRWGGDEEAFWSDTFYGFKDENPWAEYVPPEKLKQPRPIELFGVEIGQRSRDVPLGRPFMARFGDMKRIDASARTLRVTLKSGTSFDLNRLEADDFADGLRVWDANDRALDLPERRIRSVEFHPTPALRMTPERLHGTVHTRSGEFTGFLQWNRKGYVVSDPLVGPGGDIEANPRFETIRSIARDSSDGSLVVALRAGGEITVTGSHVAGAGNLGVSVDDSRYGRVLVSWDAFERVDFSAGPTSPSYQDFPAGHPLSGTVTDRSGRRLAGRLVFDLDESETTETLDAPSEGVTYTIPFGQVASIATSDGTRAAMGPAKVTLRSGEELLLDRTGDLSEGNGGMLIFSDSSATGEYMSWDEVARIDFERPPDI